MNRWQGYSQAQLLWTPVLKHRRWYHLWLQIISSKTIWNITWKSEFFSLSITFLLHEVILVSGSWFSLDLKLHAIYTHHYLVRLKEKRQTFSLEVFLVNVSWRSYLQIVAVCRVWTFLNGLNGPMIAVCHVETQDSEREAYNKMGAGLTWDRKTDEAQTRDTRDCVRLHSGGLSHSFQFSDRSVPGQVTWHRHEEPAGSRLGRGRGGLLSYTTCAGLGMGVRDSYPYWYSIWCIYFIYLYIEVERVTAS